MEERLEQEEESLVLTREGIWSNIIRDYGFIALK